ncbi:hypothetical protein [Desulfospira joergensenii]|uniref:hypothetical protein n=1 Tax=Desulfospira joergensenii TaxID=53329 RepID=UPI0003B51C76|nr:hypothetical protein [Desulfospira joergensenii]
MKYVFLSLNWLFGSLSFFSGCLLFFNDPLSGLCLITIGCTLLPPVRKIIHQKTGLSLSVGKRSVAIIAITVLFITFTSYHATSERKKIEQKKITARKLEEQKQRQKAMDDFASNRDKIIASLNNLFSTGNYQDVLSESEKYSFINDDEIKKMRSSAKSALKDLNRKKRTDELLAELKDIPQAQYNMNLKRYKELLKLNPGDERFSNKVEFYTQKIKEQQQELIAKEERKKRIEHQFSPWDGAHRNLERFIKESMNDPDSYDHVKTVYWDLKDHLVVLTTFRGKNAFGGVVKNSVKAKVGLDGDIIEILEQF